MGIEIYKGIERAIERQCKDLAEKIVKKEMEPYFSAIDGFSYSQEDRKTFFAFRELAIGIRTKNLIRAVSNSTYEASTEHLKTLLNSNALTGTKED